jgi:acetolactate synthase-1/2/3 large subunit
LLDELARAIGPETVVVKDATIPAYTWGNRLLPVGHSRAAIMPNGFAIGLGLAHAVGAGAAAAVRARTSKPDPVVLMTGDGGVMLSVAELATLAAERLPVVVLVFCDGGYGILRNIQDKQYGEEVGRIGVELGAPDFVALAGALGVGATRVTTTTEFGNAVREALSVAEPYLVEVDLDAIGPMSRPYTGTSRPPEGATKAG